MALEYRTLQINAEVLAAFDKPVRVSQVNAEVIAAFTAPVRVNQICVEVIRTINVGVARRRQLLRIQC